MQCVTIFCWQVFCGMLSLFLLNNETNVFCFQKLKVKIANKIIWLKLRIYLNNSGVSKFNVCFDREKWKYVSNYFYIFLNENKHTSEFEYVIIIISKHGTHTFSQREIISITFQKINLLINLCILLMFLSYPIRNIH